MGYTGNMSVHKARMKIKYDPPTRYVRSSLHWGTICVLLGLLVAGGIRYLTTSQRAGALDFTTHLLSGDTSAVGVLSVEATDIDDDGDIDAITCGKDGLKVYVMCEIPSNVILASEFCQIFDGFSIGSNDLTQLTLGVDRDSALVAHVYDEKNQAVKMLIRQVIEVAHKYGCKVGICGQAPSDYPEFAEFLVQEGIDSISLNPDTVLKTRARIAEMEKKISKKPGKKINKTALALKMLLIFGTLGIFTALGGYTCQTVNNQQVAESMKNELTAEIIRMKGTLRNDITQELQSKLPKASYYSEDSFVKFTLAYPSRWLILHGEDLIKFYSADNGSWFAISARGDKPPTGIKIITSTWYGYPAKFHQEINPDGELHDKVLVIYPYGYKQSKTTVTIAGSKDEFDELVNSFTEFKINK